MDIDTLFQTEHDGDIVIITPLRNMGEFDLAEYDIPLLKSLKQLTAEKDVVIDFSHTDYFGSSTIGIFIQLIREVQKAAHHIVFCNLSEHEQEVIRVTNLDKLWNIVDTRDDALKHLRAINTAD